MGAPTDTIFAVSSGPGRGAIAVIRLSGPAAGTALGALTGRSCPAARVASVRDLRHPDTKEPFDHALVLWLPAPASFTGEDMAELHIHGGRAVMAGVLEALGALKGLRPAEPGEFARRAFDRGRLALVEAEGLADLIGAETAAQRRQALRQMGGALGALYEGWRTTIIEAMALAEAAIDFSDQDLPDGLDQRWRRSTRGLDRAIAAHLDDGRRGEMVRDGFEIAVLGPPNAGKSSLVNILARRDVAIVAETAGTTRDVLEVRLDLGGYPVTLADTAGLRDGADAIEAEGVRRARRRAEEVDLKIVLLDGARPLEIDETISKLIDKDALLLINKSDLLAATSLERFLGEHGGLAVSCLTGSGIDALLSRLVEMAGARMADQAAPTLTRARHRTALTEARAALARVLEAPEAELAAEDLRLAARALGRITGRVDVEDVLDQVFRSFCIGK